MPDSSEGWRNVRAPTVCNSPHYTPLAYAINPVCLVHVLDPCPSAPSLSTKSRQPQNPQPELLRQPRQQLHEIFSTLVSNVTGREKPKRQKTHPTSNATHETALDFACTGSECGRRGNLRQLQHTQPRRGTKAPPTFQSPSAIGFSRVFSARFRIGSPRCL